MPIAPAPNGIESAKRIAGSRIAATTQQELVAHERVDPGRRGHKGDRDHRQGDDVRQQPLVEVGRHSSVRARN